MGTNHGGVNFGRRLPPIGGQYSTPINTLGYEGGYDAVRRHARVWRRRHRLLSSSEAYVPLIFDPGEAYQFDWSHEYAVLSGTTTKVKAAHMRLCHNPAGVDPEHDRLAAVHQAVPLVVRGPADPVPRPDPHARRLVCCFADYLVSVWSVYFDGLVRGFLTLFQFFRTVSVTVAGLRDEGRWRPENG